MAAELTNQDRLNLRRSFDGPAFLKEGFRPLFLAAGVWAAISVPLWIGILSGTISYTGAFGPVIWHVHEMLFGFVAAALGGFLLTAVPNWTGRLPVRGVPLACLAGLWLAGRVAVWFSGDIGVVAAAILDLSYLGMLLIFIAREIVAGRNWRNAPVLAGLALMVVANLLFHLDACGVAETDLFGQRLGIAVMMMLIALIGGRIVPSFTRNWFARNDGPEIAAPMMLLDRLTLAVSVLSLAAWVFQPDHPVIGGALALSGALHLLRLARWRGWRATREPLVSILHIAYFWLAVGYLILGWSIIDDTVNPTAGLHVITIGAMGTMILAVMTRAILGHTGRDLMAGAGTVAVYGLVTLSLLLRVGNELVPSEQMIQMSAVAWTAGFALFVVLYAPTIFGRR